MTSNISTTDPASPRALLLALAHRGQVRLRSVFAVCLAFGAAVAWLFREDVTWALLAGGITFLAGIIIIGGLVDGPVAQGDHEALRTLWWHSHHVRLLADSRLDLGDREAALREVESLPIVTPWDRFQHARIAWRADPTGPPRDDLVLAEALEIPGAAAGWEVSGRNNQIPIALTGAASDL